MASNAPIPAPVSTPIKALIEQIGGAMAGQHHMPSPAAIYGQLIRIRDEAELLEVRATARDVKVAALLAELATAADRLEQRQTAKPNWFGLDMARGPEASALVVIEARRAGTTAAIEDVDAELERRWSKIRCGYLQLRDATQGDKP